MEEKTFVLLKNGDIGLIVKQVEELHERNGYRNSSDVCYQNSYVVLIGGKEFFVHKEDIKKEFQKFTATIYQARMDRMLQKFDFHETSNDSYGRYRNVGQVDVCVKDGIADLGILREPCGKRQHVINFPADILKSNDDQDNFWKRLAMFLTNTFTLIAGEKQTFEDYSGVKEKQDRLTYLRDPAKLEEEIQNVEMDLDHLKISFESKKLEQKKMEMATKRLREEIEKADITDVKILDIAEDPKNELEYQIQEQLKNIDRISSTLKSYAESIYRSRQYIADNTRSLQEGEKQQTFFQEELAKAQKMLGELEAKSKPTKKAK